MFLNRHSVNRIKAALYASILVLVVLLAFLFAEMAGESSSKEGLRIARESIQRAAVQCYALEGEYPPSYDYLKEHYGIKPNEDLYFIRYQFIASNLMPDITVLLAGGGEGF